MKNRANLNSNPLSRGPKRLSGLKQAVAAALALSLFVGTTGVAIAEAPMSAESPMALPDANLVIYRSGEANKTQSVNYRLYVDGKPVGKLRHNTAFPLSTCTPRPAPASPHTRLSACIARMFRAARRRCSASAGRSRRPRRPRAPLAAGYRRRVLS